MDRTNQVEEVYQFLNSDQALMLEVEMTESAFGHEYALMNLTESVSYTQKEAILLELEKHRQRYFTARHELSKLDPAKLIVIEENLRVQKEIILREKTMTVH